jgi:hypothetical protein
MSLEDAIAQQINLGQRDPLTIADKCANLYGGDWVAEQLAANWKEILAEIARQKLGNERRSAIHSIGDLAREKAKPAKRDLLLTTLFIPSRGYIALGEATDEDLGEAAGYRRRLAGGLIRWADWYDDVRTQLLTQNVLRVRELRGQLPALPSPELVV